MCISYHLSYYPINIDKYFGENNVSEAKRYLLCVLKKTKFNDILYVCESTLIIEYDSYQTKLFDYLETNLAEYFYYSISIVALDKSSNELIRYNVNVPLKNNFKEELKELSCMYLGKKISNY